MFTLKIAAAALLALSAASALAQAPSMDGMRASEPHSNKSSNIGPRDTRSVIAPTLPASPVGMDAAPREYLRSARASLAAGHTGQAQQSLEMAQTRILTRVTTPEDYQKPSTDPMIGRIRDALHALEGGDRAGALQIIDMALAG